MPNPRAKGQRVQLKAVRFALSFPGTKVITLYQVSRWATQQPFDILVLRETYWPRFVEVRANQWRTGKASTLQLASLPGEGYHKHIWMFPDHVTIPHIRQWQVNEWVHQDNPWEGQ